MVPHVELLKAISEAQSERAAAGVRADETRALEIRLGRAEQDLLASRAEVASLRRTLAAAKISGETASALASTAEESVARLREEVLGLENKLMQKERDADAAKATLLVRLKKKSILFKVPMLLTFF
jgi:hypothetical protein